MNPKNHLVLATILTVLASGPVASVPARAAERQAPAAGPDGQKLVPVEVKLPKAMFLGTPKNIKAAPTLEKYSEKPRPPFYAPQGVTNLAAGKKVTSSDPNPIIGELSLVTDGDKDGGDGSFVELAPGKQWVQIDLEKPADIYAVVVWHFHAEGRVYHGVIVRVADDPDFAHDVKTVFNNDFDNSTGLGVGKDLEYIDDYQGKLINACNPKGQPVRGRYVRLHSNGNTSNDQNHYIEVEVYGKPAK
ncbi:MAG: hypothetical protein ABR915_04605 [Thermoguttaceae bacterium]|jgi:ribosomal protein L35AE/L33A